jgi:hypothetical protein
VATNGGTVSSNTLAAVSTFCAAIDAAGIRDRFYRLNLFCGDGLTAALVPLYRAESLTASARGNTTDTNNNFVAADFNNTGSSSGLTGNGTSKFLNTGYPANTLAAANTHMAVRLLAADTNSASDRTLVGTYSTTGATVFGIDARRGATNANGACALGIFNGSPLGWFGEAVNVNPMAAGTIVASAGTQYRDGTAVGGTAVGLTNYPASHSFYIHANDNGAGGGAAVNYTNARIGMYSLGAAMTASQALALSNALAAFNTTLSRT